MFISRGCRSWRSELSDEDLVSRMLAQHDGAWWAPWNESIDRFLHGIYGELMVIYGDLWWFIVDNSGLMAVVLFFFLMAIYCDDLVIYGDFMGWNWVTLW